jgi:hypothetical protein
MAQKVPLQAEVIERLSSKGISCQLQATFLASVASHVRGLDRSWSLYRVFEGQRTSTGMMHNLALQMVREYLQHNHMDAALSAFDAELKEPVSSEYNPIDWLGLDANRLMLKVLREEWTSAASGGQKGRNWISLRSGLEQRIHQIEGLMQTWATVPEQVTNQVRPRRPLLESEFLSGTKQIQNDSEASSDSLTPDIYGTT